MWSGSFTAGSQQYDTQQVSQQSALSCSQPWVMRCHPTDDLQGFPLVNLTLTYAMGSTRPSLTLPDRGFYTKCLSGSLCV